MCSGNACKTVSELKYSSFGGSLVGAAVNNVERNQLSTPEGQPELYNMLYEQYLRYLPDYTRTAPNEYALN